MQPILLFIMESCPHCKRALAWMEELQSQDVRYAELKVDIVDENRQSELASQYDYYYVPTFYVNGVKEHEGVASLDIIRNVFDKALS